MSRTPSRLPSNASKSLRRSRPRRGTLGRSQVGSYRPITETLEGRIVLSFGAATNFTVGNSPRDVIVADVNGDGKPDLVATNRYSNSVSILLGNGNGTSQAASNFAAGDKPLGVAAADVNRDGKLDLMITSWNGSSVYVLLGNGDGTFQEAHTFPAPGSSVAVGNFNSDSVLYLVTGSVILLGNGDGSFLPIGEHGGRGSAVAVADVNGDSLLDLAVVNVSLPIGVISVLLGNGDGSLQEGRNFSSTGVEAWFLVLNDFTGDG